MTPTTTRSPTPLWRAQPAITPRGAARGLVALIGIVLASGCETGPSRAPAQPAPARRTVEEWDPNATPPPADVLAVDSVDVRAPSSHRSERAIAAAAAVDFAFDDDAPVAVRRYVYRVRLAIPSVLGDATDLAPPLAELYIDASNDRLRARFVGVGWPVAPGSEVRLRGDSPGAYLIDDRGGRPLVPGELAEWFEGGELRPGPQLSVRRDPNMPTGEATGELVCALLAEWMDDDRDSVVRRCDGRAPIGFRVGLWRAERTADIPLQVPRRSMRADHLGELPSVDGSASHVFFEPSSLDRIHLADPPSDEERTPPEPEPPATGLDVDNRSNSAILVTLQGVPIGWTGAGQSLHVEGLREGTHYVGAMRPLGSIAMRPRYVDVPGRTTLRMPRRRPE